MIVIKHVQKAGRINFTCFYKQESYGKWSNQPPLLLKTESKVMGLNLIYI